VDNGSFGYYPTHSFNTAKELNSPQTNFLQWNTQCDDGHLYLITPRGWGIQNPGPMLLDERGDLIWAKHFDNEFGGQAYDAMVQAYQGQDYLTFWLGDDRIRGHGSGFYYMLNSSYDIVHRIGAANGLTADLHEFLITPEGSALMTMYEVYQYDLAEFPGYRGEENSADNETYIWDCIFQEIDIRSGDLLYEWRASEHVGIASTYRGIGPGGSRDDPFDWFHINSVHKDELGNYLISARYTHSITYIDGKTNETLWTLGGRLNDFMDLSDGNAINFAWQHDARFLPEDTFPTLYTATKRVGYTSRLLSLFDNAAEDQHYDYGAATSRGLLLEVTYPTQSTRTAPDLAHRQAKSHDRKDSELDLNSQKVLEINGTNPEYTVRIIQAYENPDRIPSSSQGSMQILPQSHGRDAKVFIGYGLNAIWTEFAADGTILCHVHYGATTSWERGDIQSYRAYKFPWHGAPRVPPAVSIRDDEAAVSVSWNGATEVASWKLQHSDTNAPDPRASWRDVPPVRKLGFETSILLPEAVAVADAPYLRVLALDHGGRHLPHGTSAVLERRGLGISVTSVTGRPRRMAPATSLGRMGVLGFVAGTAYVMFESVRRYLSWMTGSRGAGPLRWRM
jgi:hypothetical protein